MKNDITYFGLIILLFYQYYKYYKISGVNIYYNSISNLFFSLFSILITMKIRFKNDFDGLKLYYNRNFFYLPLIDNKKGKPKMILGQILIDFIKKNQY